MVDWADCGRDDDDADAYADADDDDDDDDDGDDIPMYPLIRTCKYPHACINTCIYIIHNKCTGTYTIYPNDTG